MPQCMQADVSLSVMEQLLKKVRWNYAESPLLPTSHICNMHLLICPCQVPVFQDTETAFLRHLSLTAQPLIFLPGEYIVRKGDIGYGLFLIYSGKVSTEPHFAHHVPGSYRQYTLYMCVFCALGGSFR